MSDSSTFTQSDATPRRAEELRGPWSLGRYSAERDCGQVTIISTDGHFAPLDTTSRNMPTPSYLYVGTLLINDIL